MDDTLQINPAQLSGSIENQMNLFTMEHEENYGDMMNELMRHILSHRKMLPMRNWKRQRKIWTSTRITVLIFRLICADRPG